MSGEEDSSSGSTYVRKSAIPSSEVATTYPDIQQYSNKNPPGRHASTHTQSSRHSRRFDPTPNNRRHEKSNDGPQLPSLENWHPSISLSVGVFQGTPVKDNLSNQDVVTVKVLRDKLISTLPVYPKISNPPYRTMWETIRDNCIIYPITIFSVWTILRQTEKEKFFEAISAWNTWNSVKAVVEHDMIRASICQFIVNVQPKAKLSEQPKMIDQALNEDLIDFSAHVERTISSPAMRAIIISLSKPEIQRFMGALQMLIETEFVHVSSKRIFERFLGALVKHTHIFPEYIFVTGAKRIGRNPHSGGGFADVWRGELRGKPIAMKVLRMYQYGKNQLEKVHQKFCEEAWLWQRLRHENVLPFYGVCKDEFAPMLAMISPWMDNGNLVTYLQENDLDAFNRQGMVRGVAAGLRFLHGLKPIVVHGDLRAGNVLIDSWGKPRIADFGLARIIDSQASSVVATSFNGKGTMRWQAPELLNASRFEEDNGGVTVKSDVYAFACVCFEIFTGEIPFANLRDGAVILAVAVNNQRPPRPTEPATSRGLEDEYWKLIQSCWATLPLDRPPMDEVNKILDSLFWSTFNSAVRLYGPEFRPEMDRLFGDCDISWML